jgi:hypothetical protein
MVKVVAGIIESKGDLDFVDFFINQPRSVSLSKRFLYKIPSDKSQTSDRNEEHIFKNLISVGVLDKSPRALSPKIYFEIEQKFKDFSDEINIPMDEFDLLFWSMKAGEILK